MALTYRPRPELDGMLEALTQVTGRSKQELLDEAVQTEYQRQLDLSTPRTRKLMEELVHNHIAREQQEVQQATAIARGHNRKSRKRRSTDV